MFLISVAVTSFIKMGHLLPPALFYINMNPHDKSIHRETLIAEI